MAFIPLSSKVYLRLWSFDALEESFQWPFPSLLAIDDVYHRPTAEFFIRCDDVSVADESGDVIRLNVNQTTHCFKPVLKLSYSELQKLFDFQNCSEQLEKFYTKYKNKMVSEKIVATTNHIYKQRSAKSGGNNSYVDDHYNDDDDKDGQALYDNCAISSMAKKMQKLQDSWADLTTSGCEKDHQETCFDEARRQDDTDRLVLDENEDQHNHFYDNGNSAGDCSGSVTTVSTTVNSIGTNNSPRVDPKTRVYKIMIKETNNNQEHENQPRVGSSSVIDPSKLVFEVHELVGAQTKKDHNQNWNPI